MDRIAQRHDGLSRIAAAPCRPGAVAACAAAALVVAAFALLAPGAQAATYKWVDDKGVVHYTDKIPPEAMNKGNVELDKNAVPIRKTDPPLTIEQRRARMEEEARLQQLAKERELVDRRDRALLATYTMESEIDLARKRALTTIDAQVQSSLSYSATLGKRRAELDKRVAELAGKPVPPVLERELANIDAELAKQNALVAAKQKEIVVVNARYDADKKRWKNLRATTEAMSTGEPRPTPISARQ